VEIAPTDECDNTHRFTGHERDLETGNDYMHFRFFSASMGRFQKPDSNFDSPLSNPQGWNLYSYVKGNPVNFNDPTGHAASDPTNNTANVQGESTHTPEEEKEKQEALAKLRARERADEMADLMQGPRAFHAAVALSPVQGIGSASTLSNLGQTMGGRGSSQSRASMLVGEVGPISDFILSFLESFIHPVPAGLVADTVDQSHMFADALEKFLKLQKLSTMEAMKYLNAQLVTGVIPQSGQYIDAFANGVAAWQQVCEDPFAEHYAADVVQGIRESSDAIMNLRRDKGVSYRALFAEIISNDFASSFMTDYERKFGEGQ
jgi:RHS repeat-associated protein